MNIAFLIGNGFDLNLGLKTGYGHFYKYYCAKKSNNLIIEQFKNDINNPNYDWSDLERALGEYTERFKYDQEEDFITLLDDIQDSLSEYLDMQSKKMSVSLSAVQNFLEYISNIDKYLSPVDAESLSAYRNIMVDKDNDIDFIVFNYTDTLEHLVAWEDSPIFVSEDKNRMCKTLIKSIEHIHGTTKNNMIMGVNDESQILNNSFAESESILQAFKKQEMNINTETLRDERCKKIIDEADFICIFGMSLGDTDKCWWQYIVNRLNTSLACAAIFSKTEEISPIRMYRAGAIKRSIKYKLLNSRVLSDEDMGSILPRIFVSLNSGLFQNIGVEIAEDTVDNEQDNIFAVAQYLTDMANTNKATKKAK